ncbi:MAG: hypothetical protein M3Y57_16895 [Acidobacteriota bacterium]|nr:hypothetical protein [Acidobacteriota bacterium]
MPLSKIQTDILRLLAAHRDPESYVAGSSPLNRDAPRYSGDIDVFHDREERVAQAAQADSALLQKHGYALEWQRREPAIYALVASRPGETTKLEWVVDSDFRFFPTLRDETFGYVLHPVDLATNKVGAAYGRREPRDVVDLLTIHDQILPLGAVVWASAGKALGFTPEGIINEIRRVARYTDADFRRLASDPPLDPAATMTRLREVLNEAEAFVTRMPTDKLGLLFLKVGRVVQPDPDRLHEYQTHAGQRRGQWPTSADITAAMFERYNKKPNGNEPNP